VGHAFRAAVSVILGSIPSPGLASDLFKPPLVTHLFGLCWPLDISQAALTRELFCEVFCALLYGRSTALLRSASFALAVNRA
jgi:hypothetical protein